MSEQEDELREIRHLEELRKLKLEMKKEQFWKRRNQMSECEEERKLRYRLGIARLGLAAIVSFVLIFLGGCWIVNHYDLLEIRALREQGVELEVEPDKYYDHEWPGRDWRIKPKGEDKK